MGSLFFSSNNFSTPFQTHISEPSSGHKQIRFTEGNDRYMPKKSVHFKAISLIFSSGNASMEHHTR